MKTIHTISKWRDILRRGATCLGCLCVVLTMNGATPTTDARRRPPEKAWFTTRSVCVFPLEKDGLPRTGGQLADSMLGGWREVFKFADPSNVILMQGGRYPAIDTMFVDFSGAIANPNFKMPALPDSVPATKKSLAVHNFAMLGEPMISRRSKLNVRVTGRDMRFELQHDVSGKPVLMLADAKEGMLHFDTTHEDLERMMLSAAREAGGSHAMGVKSVELDLHNVGPRSLHLGVHITTTVAFIPAGLRFSARMDVDDKMNARISELNCEGDEVLGPLIVGLIRPGLQHYEGMTKPLLAFPSSNLKLRDVQISAGEHIDMTAYFGN